MTSGDVRHAVAKGDGYILREQKHRAGKTSKSPSPMLPEVLEVLDRLVQSVTHSQDDAPLFLGKRGRHEGKPLGDQGIRGIIRELFEEEGVRDEVPDAIPYDLRDSFAAYVGRAVRTSGGRVEEAREVARRLLGHGDGKDVLARYWDDDERHIELAEYSPLRLVVEKTGGNSAENGDTPLESGNPPVESGGKEVEIGGLEPPTSAMRTPRSPS